MGRCHQDFAVRVMTLLFAIGLVATPSTATSDSSEDGKPVRIDDWLPGERVSLSVNFRARYEHLDEQFRVGTQGAEPIVALRTLVHGQLRPIEGLTAGAEFADSRAYESDARVLNTGVVNAAELLRAYVRIDRDDVLGGRLRLTGGRLTMDVGSRRLVARNRYRNTINSFTGIDVEWTSAASRPIRLRAFWTLPVERLPRSGEKDRLDDNDVEFDEEDTHFQFWGLYASHPLLADSEGRLSLFGLHEDDTSDRPSRNRELYTVVAQWLRKPALATFDFQLEVAFQWGDQRRTTAALDRRDLSHSAHFEHAELGYTFDAPAAPRVALQWDYASGDSDPTDGKSERFDTLFGARRFDFGPTGIYGPFARANLMTPGLRVQLAPFDEMTAFVSYRAFWLAEKRDTWATTGVTDPAGRAGRFVGSQLEWRLRWSPRPGNLLLEMGYARLFSGDFMRQAPNSPNRGDVDYVYTQAVVQF